MRRASLVVLAGAALVAGCSAGLPAPRLDAGAQAYRAGEPAFVLDAVATSGAETGIDVYLGLPPASVVHRRTGDSLVAVVRWTISVEREGAAPVVRSPVDTLRAATAGEALATEPVWHVERVAVPPGRYLVRVVLEDRWSERTAERRAAAEVEAPGEAPALGTIRLEGEGSRGLGPLDAGAVPAGLDSLRAVVQATNLPDGSTTVLTVERVRADTAAAVPLIAFTPPLGSLAARGLDLGSTETVQRVSQPVESPDVVLDVEAPLPALGPAVYRVRLDVRGPDGADLDTAERLVVVRRRDYPRVTRLGDLIAPLVYLAEDREMDRLREAKTDADRRRAFDRFWGERMDDRRVAAATVRAFYERVEEANRLFGTYKEGWKTDPGMVYVLFGAPRYVEATPEGERWTYGGGGAAPPVFVFQRTAGRVGEEVPVTVLTVLRDRAYAESWRRARRQWRTGIVP